MKKAVYQLMALFVVLALLVGCAPAATPAPAPAAPAEPAAPVAEPAKPFRVAVVTPSTVNDYAFSQCMMEALKVIQAEMGGPSMFEIAVSESMFQVPDAAAAIRDYASQGYDLVIAHGSQYGTSLQQVAPDFPDVSFAWGTSLETFQKDGIENVFAYQAEAQEGGYAMGVLSAYMSKTGKVGVTGPVEAGDAKLYVDGFVAGVKNAGKPADVAGFLHGFLLRCFSDGCRRRDAYCQWCRHHDWLLAVGSRCSGRPQRQGRLLVWSAVGSDGSGSRNRGRQPGIRLDPYPARYDQLPAGRRQGRQELHANLQE
jgi:basic membrane lipoprotein Med (substrate-binding protein (PBP1-ABC) superfamily)